MNYDWHCVSTSCFSLSHSPLARGSVALVAYFCYSFITDSAHSTPTIRSQWTPTRSAQEIRFYRGHSATSEHDDGNLYPYNGLETWMVIQALGECSDRKLGHVAAIYGPWSPLSTRGLRNFPAILGLCFLPSAQGIGRGQQTTGRCPRCALPDNDAASRYGAQPRHTRPSSAGRRVPSGIEAPSALLISYGFTSNEDCETTQSSLSRVRRVGMGLES